MGTDRKAISLNRLIPGAMRMMVPITLSDRSGNVKGGGKPSLHRAGRKQHSKALAKHGQRNLPHNSWKMGEEQLIEKYSESIEKVVQRDLIKRKQAISAQDITGVPPLAIATVESRLAELGIRGEPLKCHVSGREWIVFRQVA